jgi:WD40 repeat protein
MLGLLLVERVCGKSEGRYPGLYTLTGHTNRVASVAISLDGQHVVSGSYDKLVKIWNVETGAAVSILERAR